MIEQATLDEIRSGAIERGFTAEPSDRALNDLCLKKDLGHGELMIWMRDKDRTEELVHVVYSQGYEEIISLSDAKNCAAVLKMCEIFEDAMKRIIAVSES